MVDLPALIGPGQADNDHKSGLTLEFDSVSDELSGRHELDIARLGQTRVLSGTGHASSASPEGRSGLSEGVETAVTTRHIRPIASAEPARHALYTRLEEVLGNQHAETIMRHLPEHEADQGVTKDDFAQLEARFEARFDRLEARIDQMQRTFVMAIVGSMTALTAIFSLVVGLIT